MVSPERRKRPSMRTTWRVMAPETGSVAFVRLQTCVIAFLLALFAPSAESFAASSGVSGIRGRDLWRLAPNPGIGGRQCSVQRRRGSGAVELAAQLPRPWLEMALMNEGATFFAGQGRRDKAWLLQAMRASEQRLYNSRGAQAASMGVSSLSLEQAPDQLPAPREGELLSDRVLLAVQTIQRRKSMFRQYAQDIQGRTGLGGLAALAYCRRIVNRRESVWGDLLMIVMENQPKAVEEIVLTAARETLTAPIQHAEWNWFRDNLLSTFLWFEPSADMRGRFLYERLLDIASEMLDIQLESIPSKAFLPGGPGEIRQDHRLVGNSPAIRQQLLGNAETTGFYDLNVYLNDLLCIARIINPDFQAHVANLLAPMHDRVRIEPGPLKSLTRCRAKVAGEYSCEQWPTSAHLLDLVRVSATFDNEQDLRQGLALILRAANVPVTDFLDCDPSDGQLAAASDGPPPGASEGAGGVAWETPSRFAVARVKNGFGSAKGGYRDLKLNVIYQSQQGFAMICEIALCLQAMSEYAESTHELYEILRERDFFAQVSCALGD